MPRTATTFLLISVLFRTFYNTCLSLLCPLAYLSSALRTWSTDGDETPGDLSRGTAAAQDVGDTSGKRGRQSARWAHRLCKGNRHARTWSVRGGAARCGLKLLVGGSTLGSASKPKFISNVNNAGDKYVEVQPWRYDRHGLYKAISQSVSPCQFN